MCVLILVLYYYCYACGRVCVCVCILMLRATTAMYVAGYVWIGNEFEGVDDAEDEEVLYYSVYVSSYLYYY